MNMPPPQLSIFRRPWSKWTNFSLDGSKYFVFVPLDGSKHFVLVPKKEILQIAKTHLHSN